MRRIFFASAITLLLAALPSSAAAQATGRAPQTTGMRVNVPLPASDAVLRADVKRLLTEAVPRALASDPARLAQVNSDVEQFKARTGVDARDFDTVFVGAHLRKLPSGSLKIDDIAAVARGTFRADALIASARTSAGGHLTEQTYGGKTIYVATINDQLKLFGLLKMHVGELAFCVLDQSTLALGEPAAVRATVDAASGRGHVDQALVNSVQGSPDLVAFAGNVPPGTLAGMETGLPNVDRALASIRSFYGSMGATPTGFQLTTVLRAASTADAKQLYDTADALKQVAPGLISLAGERGRLAQNAINSLKITTKGTEVQLRLEVPQGDIASLLRAL